MCGQNYRDQYGKLIYSVRNPILQRPEPQRPQRLIVEFVVLADKPLHPQYREERHGNSVKWHTAKPPPHAARAGTQPQAQDDATAERDTRQKQTPVTGS